MGVTKIGTTVRSLTVGNDDVDQKDAAPLGVASIAFTTFGTSPAFTKVSSGGPNVIRVRVTSGSGTPVVATNNLVITLAGTTRTPRRVYLAAATLTPNWFVSAVGAGTITIGTQTAPVASTAYDLELIVEF